MAKKRAVPRARREESALAILRGLVANPNVNAGLRNLDAEAAVLEAFRIADVFLGGEGEAQKAIDGRPKPKPGKPRRSRPI